MLHTTNKYNLCFKYTKNGLPILDWQPHYIIASDNSSRATLDAANLTMVTCHFLYLGSLSA
jgi:hypothetical protein